MNWNAINSWWQSHVTLRTLYLLFLGQLVSFTLALTSLSSSIIANLGVDAPVTQTAFTYLSLTLVYGSVLLYRRQGLRVPWYWYLLLGFVDVQGNILGGSNPLLGNILVIAGTIFFAMSSVGEDFFVKEKDRIEVVFMIGVYGLLVSVVQLSILELKSLESVKWSADVLSGAAMFNLSLLTDDMWAVIFGFFFYRQQVDWLYFLAFATVVIGLIIYSTTEKDPTPISALGNQNNDVPYQILDNENVASRYESSNP